MGRVNIDPRYLTYNKDEVQALLDKINSPYDVVFVLDEDEGSGEYIAGGGDSQDLSAYATKTFVQNGFVAKVSGKGLSSNDYTNEEKQKLASLDPNAQGGGDENVIETVKVNGTALVPDADKAVNVVTPKITVFTSTSSGSGGNVTFDFGTTKFSDIQNAIQNCDVVFLVNNGVKYVYSLTLLGVLEFYAVAAVENAAAMIIALQQGANDSITGIVSVSEIVNADWNESDTSSLAYIKNKPNLNNYVTNSSFSPVSSQVRYSATENDLHKASYIIPGQATRQVTASGFEEVYVYGYSEVNSAFTIYRYTTTITLEAGCAVRVQSSSLTMWLSKTSTPNGDMYTFAGFGDTYINTTSSSKILHLGVRVTSSCVLYFYDTPLVSVKEELAKKAKVTTFNVTSTTENGVTTYNWGNTKYSDIEAAISNSDIVQIVADGGLATLTYGTTMTDVDTIHVFYGILRFIQTGIVYFIISEGANDSIVVTTETQVLQQPDWSESDNTSLAFIKNKPTIPSSLSELSTDSTHQTVTNAEKTKWNAATKGLEKIAEANIDNAITAGIYEVNESAAPGVPYLLMVEVKSYTETIEDPISGEVIAGPMHLYCYQTCLRNNVISKRQRVDTGSWSAWEEVKDNTKADKVTSATANNAAALDANGNLKDAGIPAAGIPSGQVDSTSTSTAFTATVPGITELRDGVCMLLKNGVVTSAAGFTINVNGLGAKPSYSNMAAATADTTIFNVNYTMLFVYDSTRVSGGCWVCYRGYDSNTNTVGYQIRSNSSTMKVSDQTGRYRLLFTSADGSQLVPANTSSSTSATASKTVNQRAIDPHGAIIYYGYTTVLSANGSIGTSYLFQQNSLTLGYSFNRTGAALVLTYPAPVYVKCAPQSDGSAIIDSSTPYVQALPTTADGNIYIYLGRAYSATAIELMLNHPVYHYYNGAIRLWTGPV